MLEIVKLNNKNKLNLSDNVRIFNKIKNTINTERSDDLEILFENEEIKNFDINFRFMGKSLFLHACFLDGYNRFSLLNRPEKFKKVEFLLNNGANVDVQDNFCETGLMRACWLNDLELANLLLNNGANPNITDREEKTALRIAIEWGFIEMSELLLKNGANPNIIDVNGGISLRIAVRNPEIINLLKEYGAVDYI